MSGKRILTAFEEAYIRQAFCDSASAVKTARYLGLSERCIRQRYQKLRGYSLKPRQLEKTLAAKRRLLNAQRNGQLFEHWQHKKSNKPLVNEARFYKSTFEPA